jgi:hypothetical protein
VSTLRAHLDRLVELIKELFQAREISDAVWAAYTDTVTLPPAKQSPGQHEPGLCETHSSLKKGVPPQ